MKKVLNYLTSIVLFLSVNIPGIAQVAFNTDGAQPNASAMLDVKSTTRGFLAPRMSMLERDAITKVEGLLIYQTDNTPGYYYCDGSLWFRLGTGVGSVTSIATGAGLSGGPITATGTIKMADMAANTIKGNNTAGLTAPTDISLSTNQVLGRIAGNISGIPIGTSAGNVAAGDHAHANMSTGTGTANKVAFWTGTNTLSNNSNLHWDNTNGRLGIGTASPVGTLVAKTAQSFSLTLQDWGQDENGLYREGLTIKSPSRGATIHLTSDYSTWANELFSEFNFQRARSGSTSVQQFDHLGATSFSAFMSTAYAGGGVGDYTPVANQYWQTASICAVIEGVVSPGNPTSLSAIPTALTFHTTVNPGDWFYPAAVPERMRITSTGNVGIGIANPTAKLEVAGQVKITGGTPGAGKVLTSDATGLASWTAPGAASWSLSGNAGTTAGTNFIGTTDNTSLVFKVNGIQSGKIDLNSNTSLGMLAQVSNSTGASNTAIGYNALGANTTGNYNVASGTNALATNLSGTNNTATGYVALYTNKASGNTANGSQALQFNSTGINNTAIGFASMMTNSIGSNNVASGVLALRNNTTGSNNTASGNSALLSNTSGALNTAFGAFALYTNTTNYENTAIGDSTLYFNASDGNVATGHAALKNNTAGAWNVANGGQALYRNTTGNYNTAVGVIALKANTTGYNNTAIGNAADVVSGDLFNATAIGYGAIALGSNYVRIGNGSVGTIGGNVGWSSLSDMRWKENITPINTGLAFIKQLRPVQYQMKKLDDRRFNWGFLAQDIEKLVGSDNAMVSVGNDEDRTLGLRYSDFIAPIVKAMQEQQSIIEQQNQKIDELIKRIEQLEKK